jgi:glycosyltransferase involved in cell wall biosynthesis
MGDRGSAALAQRKWAAVGMNRVLITVPSLGNEFGGPVVKARGLAASLRKLGHQVTLAGAGQGPDSLGLRELGRFHATPIPRRIKPLADAIRSSDVVHILGYRDPVGTAAAFLARRDGIPYLVEPCGMHRPRFRSHRLKRIFELVIGSALLRRAHCVIATSGLEADQMVEDGIPREHLRLRANGVDADELLPLPDRGSLRTHLGIPLDAPVVLSLGRIAAIKGLTTLAQAVSRSQDTWLLVVGPDEGDGTMDQLRSARHGLGLDKRLVILPRGLWGRDKAQALADADAFCLASDGEGFGNSAAEAASVGIPVVLTNTCGVVDWLDPEASIAVPPRDVDALASALERVLHSPAYRTKARAAATRIRRALDWDYLGGVQAEIYNEARRRPAAAEAC